MGPPPADGPEEASLARPRAGATDDSTSPGSSDGPGASHAVHREVAAILLAVALALVIRQFVMEAFVIPTGSMAPTLLGEHIDVTCTHCGHGMAVTDDRLDDVRRTSWHVNTPCPACGETVDRYLGEVEVGDDRVAAVTCPSCGEEFSHDLGPDWPRSYTQRCELCRRDFEVAISPDDLRGGNKVLVDKVLYHLRPPQRWEIIVFKNPEDPVRTFIKRLVGLPGETITIEHGDVYADGELVRKSDRAQSALWQPVYDSDRPVGDDLPPWEPVHGDVTWLDRAFRLDGSPGDGPGWAEIVYDEEIRDFNPYDAQGFPRVDVGDVRLRLDVTPDRGGMHVVLRLGEGERTYRVEVPVGDGGELVLTDGGREVARTPTRLSPGTTYRLAMANVDDRVLVRVDGRVVAEHTYESSGTGEARVSLGVEEGRADVGSVRIDRDLYYRSSSSGAGHSPHLGEPLPDDAYLVLGDNTSNSADSRVWGSVPRAHLVGRAFAVFWPALPWDWDVGAVR